MLSGNDIEIKKIDKDAEQIVNGIRFTPMERKREMIAYCGLDCEKCDARKATINNDDALRAKTAKLWTELNGVEITKEMINCEGCCADGAKTPFCDSFCEIRKCAISKTYENCGKCNELETCEKVKMIISTNQEARNNLQR